jgi:tape measure domain-containing protein
MRQQSELAFTTMLGSSSKATALLDKLQDFAAKTPFQFKDLILQTQRLMAMGIAADDVIPTLTSLGDAVAGLAGGSEGIQRAVTALGQMAAAGKVTAQDMRQLTELGIPAWRYLAEAIGTDTAGAMEAVSKRSVDAATGIAALTKGMDRDFGGLMAKQSKTFGGLMSTMADTFQIVSGRVMKPFFEEMTSGLQGIADFMGTPAFSQGLTSFMGVLGTIFGLMKEVILVVSGFDPGAGGILKNLLGPEAAAALMGAFASIREGVKTLLKGIGDLFAFLSGENALAVFLRTVVGAVAVGTLYALGGALKALGEALSFLNEQTVEAELVRTVIAGVAVALGTLWTIGKLSALPHAFMAFIGPVTTLVGIMGGPLTLALLAIAAAAVLIVTHWGDITRIFNESVAGWGAIFDALGTTVRQFLDGLVNGVKTTVGQWGEMFNAIGTKVHDTLVGAIEAVGEFFNDLGTAIRNAADTVAKMWSTFWDKPLYWISFFITSAILNVGKFFEDLWKKITEGFEATKKQFGDFTTARKNEWGQFFSDLGSRVNQFFNGGGGEEPLDKRISTGFDKTKAVWGEFTTQRKNEWGQFFSDLGSRVNQFFNGGGGEPALGTRVDQGLQPTRTAFIDFSTQRLAEWGQFFSDLGTKVDAFFNGPPSLGDRIASFISEMGPAIGAALGRLKDQIFAGIGGAISGAIENIKNGARDAVRAAEEAARQQAEAHSPSRLFMRLGRDMMAGLSGGIRRSQDDVKDALEGIGTPLAKFGAPGVTVRREFVIDIRSSDGSVNTATLDTIRRVVDETFGGILGEATREARGGLA